MFSNDVKRVRFRCQTLKFSCPNVKFPRRLLLCNSPSYINKSSSTSLRKSQFGAHFDCDDSERLLKELHIRVGKLQSLTPETQTFDVKTCFVRVRSRVDAIDGSDIKTS